MVGGNPEQRHAAADVPDDTGRRGTGLNLSERPIHHFSTQRHNNNLELQLLVVRKGLLTLKDDVLNKLK